jgi:hypothetical protein
VLVLLEVLYCTGIGQPPRAEQRRFASADFDHFRTRRPDWAFVELAVRVSNVTSSSPQVHRPECVGWRTSGVVPGRDSDVAQLVGSRGSGWRQSPGFP